MSGCGRMGKRITALAVASRDVRVVGGIESPDNPDLGRDLGEVSFIGTLGARISPAADIEEIVNEVKPDILVDFTNAEASTENVVQASNLDLGIVMGTTGHSDEQMDRIVKSIGKNSVAAVISPNMSIGVNVLFEASRLVAGMVPEYDVEIFEVHHNQKIDSPSGTALKLAHQIADVLDRDPGKAIVSGRRGKGRRGKEEIGVASLRAGDVGGDHTVIFAGLGERIELTHRAHSRDAFASGVLSSIRFVSRAEPGIYSMRDVLKADMGG